MTRSIIWEKWRDPLRPGVKRAQQERQQYQEREDDDDPVLARARASFDDGNEDDDNPLDDGEGHSGSILIGPQGIVPLTESNVPSKLFNFWMGHANFKLDRELVNVVEDAPGVESLDVISPYRFRIAIGRAFKQMEVMDEISRRVQPPAPPPESPQPPAQVPAPKDPLERFKAMLARSHPVWAIAVTPNGENHGVGAETVEEVQEKLKRYPDATYVTSWEGK